MFRQCVRDAAPGSSQTAFGSGSPLLAPLSNFRAGTLPTTVSLPHSHKPETDSLPACLPVCSPSLSLSLSISLSLCVSRSLLCLHSLFFAFCHILFFCGSRSLIPRVCPLSFVPVWFCAFRIIGLQSHSQYLNHVVHCHCLLSVVPLPVSVCIFLAPTVGLLVGCKYPC